ncbi:MAG: metal ABC transporter permease [Simkania sp.]|nr:metal ABC transporter permease [Simkania sp.]
MNNPYWGCDVVQFFVVLMQRSLAVLTGKSMSLAPDEVQILVLIMIAISCGLIGTFLVIRKMTMLANSLSHTILIGIVAATWLCPPHGYVLSLPILFIAAMITAFITVGVTRLIGKATHVKEDASIGLSFTALFALGLVVLMIFTKNAHIGTEAVMGNLDAVHVHDLWLSGGVAFMNILILTVVYPVIKVISFDRAFASSARLPCRIIDALFLVLLATTSMAAFRAVGVLLVLAFLTGPILIARFFCHRLSRLMGLAVLFGIVVALISVAIARHVLSVYQVPLSTAGIAVTCIGVFFGLGLLCSRSFDFRRKECYPS